MGNKDNTMRKSNELTQTHRNSPKQINDEKRKTTDNRTKERVKGNRSSMLKRRTDRKQKKKEKRVQTRSRGSIEKNRKSIEETL